ncbi:FAD-dependent oxidoreductase [Streptomyces sp. NPDC047081]|uniref:FAD-dependent oxidoreductase n=1 Tax=Streptomyces sp. NPDC047081 TaxID=3154706 RepID=UPI0033CA845C
MLGLSRLDPRGGDAAWFSRSGLFARLVSLAHPECDNPGCHMVSFLWGTGRPALYSHGNLDPVTHDRIAALLGPVGLGYHRHIHRIVRSGRAMKYDADEPRHARLPEDYLAAAAEGGPPVLFLTGKHNRVFGDSVVQEHEEMSRATGDPDRYERFVAPATAMWTCSSPGTRTGTCSRASSTSSAEGRYEVAQSHAEHVHTVVVGSGFGGSVTAYRLAAAGQQVVLLERGRAYPPGTFARSPAEIGRAFRDPKAGLQGLFDVWSFRAFDSVVASGPARGRADAPPGALPARPPRLHGHTPGARDA